MLQVATSLNMDLSDLISGLSSEEQQLPVVVLADVVRQVKR
jgi:hypothetical protein